MSGKHLTSFVGQFHFEKKKECCLKKMSNESNFHLFTPYLHRCFKFAEVQWGREEFGHLPDPL